ncbi:2-oxoglutarate dehydrogenase E2 component (dihydrolipoamide succinyltransferase) [Lipingzhangella halophila]|uniref:Dihydrolipoamide acetyltransferase component of pyruvate dehydrogenase complex n=1 Tax=Lipingzhangella halophila TaxID=1783352 RepID=A0A7W7W1M1_9ACTN|nr:2-oxoglutarate dehydrogenase, E2 component, dihydrolipoamide succinyltransferase [Lipingzhangella halophila]MBB4930796.1 2-oxoglutarate dehydrogenase E2 component (dihydrolipoamide succinyltransferase) [Lipingzhangella halophila]
MPTSVTMPELGESVTEGTVTQWMKKEGESVTVDEPLLEVSTDKVDTEIPSPVSGVLTRILVAEDETVEIGAEIAVIGSADEAPAEQAAPAAEEAPAAPEPAAPEPEPEPEPEPSPAPASSAPPAETAEAPAARAEAPSAEQPSETKTDVDTAPPIDIETLSGTGQQSGTDAVTEAYVTPLVRKLAADEGVDLSTVRGTGVGGRIRKQDVQQAANEQRERRERAAAEPAAPAGAAAPTEPARKVVPDTTLRGRTEQMSPLRRSIAEQMAESLRISAELTQVIEVDVTNIARLRERVGEQFRTREGVELGFFPFFAVATVEALKTHPKLNAVIDSSKYEVTYHNVENLGVCVDTDGGLLAPVIKDAGDLNLGGLARKIADVTSRAHSGQLTPDELSGGTFTLNNTGASGALFETPIMIQPQVGILDTGSVVKRPVVVDDPNLGEVIAVRSMVHLALSYDHRLIDSSDASAFLRSIRERLEEGAFEGELGLA